MTSHRMANNVKDDQQPVRFGCTAKELKELMESRGTDAVTRVRHKYGSVDELCRRLHVSSNEGTLIVAPKNLKSNFYFSAFLSHERRPYLRVKASKRHGGPGVLVARENFHFADVVVPRDASACHF